MCEVAWSTIVLYSTSHIKRLLTTETTQYEER